MIVPIGTLLARAVRKRTVVPIVAATSAEVLRAAVSGTSTTYLITLIDLASDEAALLLATVYWLALRHPNHISIMVSNCTDEQALSAFPEVALLLPLSSKYQGVRPHVAVAPALIDPPTLEQLLAEDGAVAVMVPSTVTSGYVAEVCQMVQLPILLAEEIASPDTSRLLLRAGVSGLLLGPQLDQAYTAAVRAALHNREHSNPSDYTRAAGLAVHERIASLSAYSK